METQFKKLCSLHVALKLFTINTVFTINVNYLQCYKNFTLTVKTVFIIKQTVWLVSASIAKINRNAPVQREHNNFTKLKYLPSLIFLQSMSLILILTYSVFIKCKMSENNLKKNISMMG